MTSAADQNANVIFGAVIDEQLRRRGARDRDRDRLRRPAPPPRPRGAAEARIVAARRRAAPSSTRGDSLDVPSFLRDESEV